MTVLIDGRAFTAPTAGISNFMKESLIAWAKQRPYDHFVVAMPRPMHTTFMSDDLPPNIQLGEYSNAFFHRLPNLIWLLIMMPILVRRIKADVYYTPVPCLPFFLPHRIKTIIVVHDVVNIEYQHTMRWTNVLANKLFYNSSVKKADIIWTNSHYTKHKVEEYFPERRCQHIFTGGAVDRRLYKETTLSEDEKAMMFQKYHIEHPFILFVGSLEPRKNLSFLLSLMPELYRRMGIQLVIVGGKGWRNSHIRNIVENKNYPRKSTIFCGYVPNEDLAQLYHMAQCFVSTSLNEGFGMPQLEALLCGCPVVTAHNSAMIEVAANKDGAISVEGYDPQTWINSIETTLGKRPKVNQDQLKSYNWDLILANFLKRI